MNHREVIAVGGIFQLNFPVTGKAETVRGAGFDREARALLHKQVHPLFRRAEEIVQRFDMLVKSGENHAGILFGAQRNQP